MSEEAKSQAASHQATATSGSLFALPVGIVCAMIALLWLGPREAVLGQGIKIVYVHVAAMWSGLTWYVIVCLLGAWLIAVVPTEPQAAHRRIRWAQIGIWMAVVWYALGVGTSLIAARINWGGIFWGEPRMAMSLRFLLVGFAVATAALWIEKPRLLGAITLIAPGYLFWSLWSTPLRLHPRNPINSESATSISLTFLAAYVLILSLTFWLAWWLGRRIAPKAAQGTT